MARSKEQWKAQQRAQHTQTQAKTNSFVQMKRPGVSLASGGRPQLPPTTSAVYQLGRPTSAAVPTAVRPVALKPDPVRMPSVSTSGWNQAACIDLTLDDDDDEEDDEEEDEPMGTHGHSQRQPTAPISDVAAGSTVATSPPSAIAVTVPRATATTVTASPAAAPSSPASDAVKLSMLDGTGNGPTPVAASLPQIESASEMMAPMVEDVESDVDEEWPSVPPSVSEQPSAGQTEENVTAALDAIRKTIPFAQGDQEQEDDEMEADVDEELPSQAPKDGQGSSGSSTTADRVVRVENLEDGEIFEEGAAPKPAIEVQRAIMLEQQGDAHPVDPMEIRLHLRNKKQKKRGKKKTKRKLEAMQMMDTPPGEMEVEFERVTRQRPFGDAPPPGPFTYAMMRNGPRGEPVNVRPVFQDPPPASFHPGGMFAGAPHPPMRPPMPQMSAPMPPPPPYEDSRILRVNRQGSMEMLDNEGQVLIHPMFSEPPRHAGFKYRSVSMSPPQPTPSEPIHLLQRSMSDTSRLPPRPTPGHGGLANPAASGERDDPDDFDLDSLRAAALRSKTKRPAKTPTSTSEKTIELQSTSSSPTPSPLPEQKKLEPASPEIDKLRLEILRSMQRNRKRSTNKVEDKAVPSTPSPAPTTATGQPEQSSSETAMDGKEAGSVGVGKASAANADVNPANKLAQPTSEKAAGIAQPECATTDGSTCETDKSTTTSEVNESSDKGEPSSAECAKAPTDTQVATPEFRPLTACSQSLVIRLNPEDFSPRIGGNDAQAKTTTSSSLQDAIKEMRRQIAEREKAQTNRLLESAAAKLSKTSSDQGSSSSPASSSPSPLDLPPPETKTSVAVSQQLDSTAASPEVISSAIKSLKETQAAVATKRPETEESGSDVKQARDCETKENMNKQDLLLPDEQQLAETAPEQEPSTVSEEAHEPVLESPKRNDISGVSTFVSAHVLPPVLQHQVQASSDGQNGNPASNPCGISALAVADTERGTTLCENTTTRKPACASPSTPGRNDELDVRAIRAEYEQCVNECEEAEAHIARLSDEMSRLEKQLLPVGSSVEGS